MSSERVADIYPLSPMQKGMLFHTLLAPGGGDYFNQLACVLEGDLDVEAFERAWRDAIARHPALRSAFVWEGVDQPVQVVLREVELPFAREDWRELEGDEQQARFERHLAADRELAFDLGRAPLMRLHLARLAERRFRFTWSSHHLLLDGWSLAVLLGEVWRAYASRVHGAQDELAPVRPYRDFIAWLERRDAAQAESFWRERLAGFREPTPLPALRAEAGAGWDRRAKPLSRAQTERATAFARGRGLTLNVLVQAAWAVVLARACGRDDVVFGATVSGRPAELDGVESIVGLLINTLPVRATLECSRAVGEWLAALQRDRAEAAEFEWTPLVDVQRASEIAPPRPLFESLVVFESYPFDRGLEHALDGVRVLDVRALERTHYPLNLIAVPGDELSLEIGFDRSRIDGAGAELLLARLHAVLDAIVARPGALVGELGELAPDERALVSRWSDGGEPDVEPATLSELFERRVDLDPTATALVERDRSLSFAELDRRANRLARGLIERGLERALVAISLERSIELVVAMLAVAKAGGAWLPIDPDLPRERARQLFASARADALIATGDVARRLALDAATMRIDELAATLDATPSERLAPLARIDDLAYVIYTSGSTGEPKGVEVAHRGLAAILLAQGRALGLAPGRRVLQLASIGYDASVHDVWTTLLMGATLALAEAGELVPGEPLERALRELSIDAVTISPSALRELDPAALPELGSLLVAGEACGAELARAWSAGRRFVDAYGPTEATICATLEVSRDRTASDREPTLGRPLPGTRVRVLDDALEPVGVGVVGEIWIGGVGVARGYRSRAARTAERFLPDPFAPERGARMYRTGDRGRWRVDGRLEFHGRADFQVKIRGVRIEPEEVEAHLGAHASLRHVAVGARADDRGELALVAWCVARAGASVDAGELRRFLAARLPSAWVPSAFVALDALPLSPSGKVDRAALPMPRTSSRSSSTRPARPATPLEQLIAAVWREVLEVERVSVDDDFFALGGHSLRALQVVARLRDALSVELPLRSLFDAPTVAELAVRVDQARSSSLVRVSAPRRAPRDRALPLSFAQRRLWFLEQLDPAAALYVVPAAVRLRGAIDAGALQRALNGLVERHEALRTRIEVRGGEPAQAIEREVELPLATVDLRALAADERERKLRELAREDAGTPFDLAVAPLARARLARLADDEHALFLTLHHLISDGWSIAILVREIAALYAGETGGPRAELAPLPLQYADFAAWQRETLEGDALEAQLAFWRRELDGVPPLLELPTDRPRPPRQSFRGRTIHARLDRGLHRRLARFAQRANATTYMALLAAFEVWLARLSGETDFAVGSPVAGRSRPEFERVVGCFVNTLVVRARVDLDATFAELVADVRGRVLDAFAHQDLPFDKLVEELAPRREMSHAPLVQCVLVLQNLAAPRLELEGVAVETLEHEIETAKFDLTLTGDEDDDGGLALALEFDAELFDESTARGWLAAFVELVRSACADSGERVGELAMLGGIELERVLELGLGSASAYPRDATVHELFRRVARERPDAIAVRQGERELRYAELDRASNRLARRLRALGVGRETTVALAAPRSIEALVGMLAVLKAGGAYAPIDVDSPPARIAAELEQAGVGVILATADAAERLPELGAWIEPLEVDRATPRGLAAGEGDAALEPAADARSLAYVMSTSGSTGTPKSVAVVHRAIVRLARRPSYVQLGPEEAILHFAPLAFDASTFEIWGALLNGGRLEILDASAPTLEELAAFVRARGVTTMWLTAGLFHAMVDHQLAALRGVRQLLAGGEALSKPHVERALRELPDLRLINGYGPTECTTFACCHAMSARDLATLRDAGSTPIGRPIAGTHALVVDRHLRPVPRGAFGELALGGDGLARGYLGDPRRTAERFVPDPTGRDDASDGARLYRTGDRARWRSDGTLEYGGRLDRQIKLRGFRIELGEVESVLCGHRSVARCAVEPWGEGASRTLAAWCVPRDGGELDARALLDHLRARLPDYMLPAFFTALPALPLTGAGKVDRRALPDPVASAREGGGARARREPSTPIEQLLASVFADLLGLERVALDEDFFELGGHSLLATQLASRVHEVLGVELSLHAIFERTTVAALAQEIERLRAGAAPRSAPSEIGRVDDGDCEASFAQQRLWLVDRLEPGGSTYNLPFALEIAGELDVDALRAALDLVVARHEPLRTVLFERDGRPMQRVIDDARVALERDDLSETADAREEAARIVAELARRPFDLARGPMLRARLIRLDERRHVLALCVHHVACDGWSLAVLTRELSSAYRARLAGIEPTLAPLPVRYRDFAAWQRRELSGERLERELAWWRDALGGATFETPFGARRGEGHGAGELALELDAALVARVERFCAREGATPFIVLLAAFTGVVARVYQVDELVVGAPSAGRTRSEVEGSIGFFVDTLALRVDASGDPTPRELVARTRDTVLRALDHRALPFERVVEELASHGDARARPRLHVLFALQNAPPPRLELDGLELAPFDASTDGAHADVTVSIEPRADRSWSAHWEYDAQALACDEVLALANAWRATVESWLDAPDRRGSSARWYEPAADRPAGIDERALASDLRLYDAFERVARERAQAIAVEARGRSIAYGRLAAASGALARRLLDLGLAREELVGLCADSADHLALGMLAIVGADAAYVPLDAALPDERLRAIVTDSRARFALADPRWRERLERLGLVCIALDDAALAARASPLPRRLPRQGDGRALAYAIYTSGSTGVPKGVAVEQGSVANLVLASNYTRLTHDSRVARASNPAFDAVTFEVWGALLSGATLVDVERDTLLSPSELRRCLRERAITHLVLTTAVFHLVAREAPDAFATLEALFFGGETCAPELVREIVRRGKPRELVQVYGPTETTTFASWQRVDDVPETARTVPIASSDESGGEVAGATLVVLDAHGERVPDGLPGELFVGGLGVARGYLARRTATAASFVPDRDAPLGAGSRLYRTGDLVRRNARGELEFLGRRDAQVKLRGFRIELGEIDAALASHPDVEDAVALLRESPHTGKRLVAWYVPAAGATLAAAALKRFLAERLPEHALPSDYVALDALPLSRSGKIDRRALPDPDWSFGTEVDAPPRNAIEGIVAAAWCEVLGLEHVGVHDDFFALGGHSLVAVRVASRLASSLGVDVPLRALFESPTLEALAERLASLRRERVGRRDLVALAPGDDEQRRAGPLSFAQERLWFLQKLEPQSAFYNVPVALRIRGPLDVRAWRRALEELARRHPALRTRIVEREGRATQVVDELATVAFESVDLTGRPQDEVDRAIAEHARAPFDLAAGPSWRAALFELARDDGGTSDAREHVASIVVHHAFADGWTLGVLVRDLASLHAALRGGRALPPRPCKLEYLDYVRWQRASHGADARDAAVAWWREHLAGAPQTIDLFPDRARPPVQSFRGGVVTFAIDGDLSQRVIELARREGATLYMVLLAAFQALIARSSEAREGLIGTPVAGRDHAELEELAGFFVNTVVLRMDARGDPSFRELLRRVRREALDAFDRRDTPFELVVEASRPSRDPSRTPLFQVMFALQNAPADDLAIEGLAIEPLEPATDTAKFDLTLSLQETPRGLGASFEFATDLFDRATIERWARRYRQVLAGAVAAPERALSRLAIADDEERAELERWATGAPSGARAPAHELVLARAAAAPHALAVRDARAELTYGELDRAARALALRLADLGVARGDRVALCADRSCELVVGALATLVAGGAYAALDADQPPRRLAAMIAIAKARVVLATARTAERLAECGARVVVVDLGSLASDRATGKAARVELDDLAYLIFTSGSTGEPKGVELTHRGLATLVAWHARTYGVQPSDRATLLAGTGFDASVWEAWPYLASGASLHVAPDDARLDPPRLVRWLAEQRIDLAFAPTPLAEAILRERWPEGAKLRALLAGGDRLHAAPPGGLPFELFNHYGPTESTVVATACRVEPRDVAVAAPHAAPAIGRPIDGIVVRVLDAELEPCPVGVPGEIHLGGAPLARGYASRPARTAEAFVPDPWSSEPGARLYATGDVARWRADGSLEFLGRRDGQVKLRGVRVELGEIESALLEDPRVRAAAAVVAPDARLLAFVSLRAEGDLASERELAAVLAQRLPSSMLPSRLVVLASLPLNASGKLDRAALLALEPPRASAEALAAPSSELESSIASIWRAVLALERVDVETSFFDLGGHSLGLIEVQGRIRAELGREVAVVELFQHPTVRALARHLEGDAHSAFDGRGRAALRRRRREMGDA